MKTPIQLILEWISNLPAKDKDFIHDTIALMLVEEKKHMKMAFEEPGNYLNFEDYYKKTYGE